MDITGNLSVANCEEFCIEIYNPQNGDSPAAQLGYYYAKCYDYGPLTNDQLLNNSDAGDPIPESGNQLNGCIRVHLINSLWVFLDLGEFHREYSNSNH